MFIYPFHSDNSKYEYEDGNVYHIGWLAPNHTYNTGHSDPAFIEKLIKIFNNFEPVNQLRGLTTCSFCPNAELLEVGDKYLGNSEIWIPNKTYKKIFAAPSLILHYIQVHNYLPPQEFIDAVDSFDLNSDWNGELEYRKLFDAKYGPQDWTE